MFIKMLYSIIIVSLIPMNLFLQQGGKSSPGGDSVGGDVFYTVSSMLSMPFPGNGLLANNGVRLFGFANAGTLTGLDSAVNINTFIRSTRLAVGGGVCVGTPMGKMEATYAVPLRYGPRDARRSVQFGMGLTFG
jgi:outer membrane protein assembly factor BamA